MEYKILAILWLFGCLLLGLLYDWVYFKYGKKRWSDYEEGESVWNLHQAIAGLLIIFFEFGIFFYLFLHI